MSITTIPADYPTTFKGINDLYYENLKLKEVVEGLMSDAASNGTTSTALVQASQWDGALSVGAVQAMRDRAGAKKPPKGWGKRAAAQAVDNHSDDDGPLPKRGGVKGAIAKKGRKPGPKKGLSAYTYYVKMTRKACYDELAAARDPDEAKPANGEVMKLIASKWNELKGKEGVEEWETKKDEYNKAEAEKKAAAAAAVLTTAGSSDATTADASPSSAVEPDDDF